MAEFGWRVIAAYGAPESVTDEVLGSLASRLPGFGVVELDDNYEIRLVFDVVAPTLRLATDAALKVARAEYAAAFGDPGNSRGIEVTEMEVYLHRISHPRRLDLVGLTEISEMLGVSKQRAAEIAKTNADFPPSLANPAMGPVYSRESVSAFEANWDRKRTGRPRQADSSREPATC
ncbi:hypothetical protein QLQ12_45895 [Actinoplanes sp. NEAU-A12]|uniref:Uncharacterized protein n=1 Tax=Actinoplanes sandaracinus TaxID=3045177 RepID=A0ABT6X1N6_9ACTN|nr:hypothetical protein [Actinoplanes sandaracinus]MDI6105927.1 hypothetical protein [Actinoplanes sandaracinus]